MLQLQTHPWLFKQLTLGLCMTLTDRLVVLGGYLPTPQELIATSSVHGSKLHFVGLG